MKLNQLSKKYPLIASISVIVIITLATEIPIPVLRSIFAPLIGKFYGDYLADLILHAFGVICLLLLAQKVGLGKKLGLNKPSPWAALLLGWPIILLAYPDFGAIELVFDPILFIIFVFLYFFIGFLEELLFRSFVQGFFMRRWGTSYQGVVGTVLFANLLFGAAHLTNLLMGRATLLYAVVQFTYAFFFGVLFSAIYIRSGSLIPGIVLHMIYDFMANLDAFMPGALPRSEIVRNTTTEGAIIGLLISLPLFLLGIFYLRKSKLSNLSAENQSVCLIPEAE